MPMIYCYECGKKVSDTAKCCPACGAPNKHGSTNGNRTWAAAFLLCFCLGAWGAHRFYLKQTTSAIIMLVLGLTVFGLIITGIWAFVDLIIMLCHVGDDKWANSLGNK